MFIMRYLQSKTALVFIVLLIAGCYAQTAEPLPVCTSAPSRGDIPISLQQYETINLDAYFKGFNLEFKLGDGTPNFVYMNDKFVKKAEAKIKYPGLKNYHLDSDGNSWASSFILLAEDAGASSITWGKLNAMDSVPVIQGTLVVENNPNLECYDAIRFEEFSLAMLDCAVQTSKNGSYTYQNRFLYVDLVKQVVLTDVVTTPIYVQYTLITRRKLFKYTENGYHYLMRVYFADGVDEQHRDNTYVEIMSANNPKKPYVLKIMDRSLLMLPRFAITDFDLYLGDMYVLDYHQGITRFDITPAQQILITGRYRTDSGFLKFAVHSNNLDSTFLLVLANNHAVYEVDWSNTIEPKLITKYSIMPHSRVNSISVNNLYVIVQSQANVTTHGGFTTIYNSTWIFNRNSRTYMNAYAMIPHSSANTFIEFNREQSFIMSIDEDAIQLWGLGIPYLNLFPVNPAELGKEYNVTINAVSKNPISGETLPCFFQFKTIVVDIKDYRLWPTGQVMPSQYYSNYPGQLFIDLENYVLGPNITWGVKQETVQGELPAYWILQQNTTNLKWSTTPQILGNVTFLRQEQYDDIKETDLFMYLQNKNNQTFVTRCVTEYLQQDVNCNIIAIKNIGSPILNLTANRFLYFGGRYLHLMAIVESKDPNTIAIQNVDTGSVFFNLKVADGFAGQITSIEFTEGYLIAVLRFAKSIVIWNMVRCADYGRCTPIYTIDSDSMKSIGINYFSPLQVVTSDYHPYILFIQCYDQVIIVDITSNGPILLERFSSAGTNETGYFGWQMAVSRDHLVIVNAPAQIEQYSLLELYNKKVTLHRIYPLYKYYIPQTFDMDFSDSLGLVYITAKEKQTNTGVILVYKCGRPSVTSLYDVFQMNGNYAELILEVTGTQVDYVTFVTRNLGGSIVTIFRQFGRPLLVFQDTFSDFTFNITYSNEQNPDKQLLSTSTVKIANYPTDIKINNPKLNDSSYLNSLLDYKNDHRLYVLNDHTWFNGTILNYSITCETECNRGGKIQLVNHVQDARDIYATFGMFDVELGFNEMFIQQYESVWKLNHNGSINQVINIPKTDISEICLKVTLDYYLYGYYISACRRDKQINMYLTSELGFKPFTMGPQLSSASALTKLQVESELLILADIDAEPGYMRREGSLIVYRLNFNPDEIEFLDQIEVLDSNDFVGIKGWSETQAYLGNFALGWRIPNNPLWRLFITEVRYGFFTVDFQWQTNRPQINIVKTNFVNLKDILASVSLPIPNRATFEAINILQQRYDNQTQNWEYELIVDVKNFHLFQIRIDFDITGIVLKAEVVSVYYRYSLYETTNYLKCFDGYFVAPQVVPFIYQEYNLFTPQILAVYDTRPNRTEIVNQMYEAGIPAYNMMGAVSFRDTHPVAVDFNFTFNRNETDPFSKIGLVVVDAFGERIRQITLSESLHMITEPGITETQHITFAANNDYSHVKLPINIIVPKSGRKLAGWAIALIVIGSVLLASGIVFGGYWYWKKTQADLPSAEVKESLLEKEAKESGEEEGQQEGQQQGEQGQQQGQQQQGQQQGQEGQQKGEQQQGQLQEQQADTQNKPSIVESREGAVNESVAVSQSNDKP